MLARMPQKTKKSPFRNKLTILSMVLLMGLGLSAAYFTVPYLQAPNPGPENLIGNTSNNTVSSPASNTSRSEIKILTPQANSTSQNKTTPNTSMNTQNTSTTKKSTPNTSKTTTSKTSPSSTTSKKTTGKTA